LHKSKAKDLTIRYIVFIISLFFTGLGVAVTKKGELGVSPVSSIPNVLSLRFDALTMGNWLIIWNCVLILGQIILLRKKFQPIQLLQVPLSFLFGYFTDFGTWCVSLFDITTYPMRLAMIFAGTIILGFGISLAVKADVIMNAGEAFVKALSDVLKKDFSVTKTVFDISSVILSVILSLVLFSFTIKGAREGTIIAALCTGPTVKAFLMLYKKIKL